MKSERKTINEERRKIYKKMMESDDPEMIEALAKAYDANCRTQASSNDKVEYLKIGAMLLATLAGVGTNIYLARQALLFEETGSIRTKVYPYPKDVKVIKF